MHEQDWQEPLTLDWTGASGPLFTPEDVHNCVIHRILRNDFHPPWETPPRYVRQIPWWDPNEGLKRHRSAEFIPGKPDTIPQYPRLSTLTKKQHLSALKVLSSKYEVHPLKYPFPTLNDIESFEKINKKYKREQNEYRIWAKKCWVNEDCIRALHPNPILEAVYEAQFGIKKNAIRSLPINYRMSAQISLQTKVDFYEFDLIKDLKTADITSLPKIKYPNLSMGDVSIMKDDFLPKVCHEHPTRFILPDEDTPTALPLPEVYKKLAHFALENGAEIIASESALGCILDVGRSWKIYISVVEVVCPDGAKKNVLVLGQEVTVQKEGGAQRTYNAYRGLLRHTFTTWSFPSTETDDTDPSICGSEPNELLDVNEEGRRSTEIPNIYDDSNNSNAGISGCGSEHNELMDVNEEDQQSTQSPLRSYYDQNNSNALTYAELSNCSSEPKELVINEEAQQSTQSPLGSYDDTNNSNALADPELSNCGSEPKELVINEEAQQSTQSPLGSYDDTNNSNALADPELSNSGSEPKELVINEEAQQSTQSPLGSYDDTNNSNALADPELSNCGSEPKELVINEEAQQSTQSPLGSYDDTNNSNALADPELSNCGSEPKELVINEEAQQSTQSPLGSYDDTNNSNALADPELSNSGSEPKELVINEEAQQSTQSPLGSYDDTNNSNALADAELSNCGSEPKELLDDNEQRQRSAERALVAFDNTINRNALSDAELSSSDSESNRLIIDYEDEEMNNELNPEVSNPAASKQENTKGDAEFDRQKLFLHLFGTESEESSQTEADIDLSHGENKQINFAAMYTEINKSEPIDQIIADKPALPTEPISGILNENMSSIENMDVTNCTCEGTMSEVPQHSFKKWYVKTAVSNQSLDIIITCCHDARDREGEVILEPIVEWQPELGARQQSAGRLRALALALMMRPHAKLINVRVDYKNGNIIVIDKLDEAAFTSRHGDKTTEIVDGIHTTIDQLRFLKPGQYILAHDSGHGPHAMLYAAGGGASSRGEHSLSLRPEQHFLPESVELTLAKIPPELSEAMLPYHKGEGILPLAFTTQKKHVKGYKKAAPPIARGKRPYRAMQGQKKKRKSKKKPRPVHLI